jgi:hypothetical protein
MPDLLPEQEDDATESRKTDSELLTMGRIFRQLSELDDAARTRVVAWLAARFAGGGK